MNEDQATVAEDVSQSYEQTPAEADPWEQAVSEGTEDIRGTMSGPATRRVNIPGVGQKEMRPVGPAQAEQVEGEEAAQLPDPLDATVDVPGVGPVKYRELVEWRNRGLMQADYTRKTQSLAQVHRQIQEKERQLDENARALMGLATQLQASQQQQTPQMPQGFQPEDAEDPYYQRMITQERDRIAPVYQRLEALEKQNQEYQQYVQTQQHQAAVSRSREEYEAKLNALQKEFEYMDPEVVVAWLINDPAADMRELARQSHARSVQRFSTFQSKAQQPVGPQTRRTTPPRSSGAPPLATEPIPTNWGDAIQGAKDWLKSQR